MTPKEAKTLLGLGNDALSESELKAAYSNTLHRLQARLQTSVGPQREEVIEQMTQLNEARHILMKTLWNINAKKTASPSPLGPPPGQARRVPTRRRGSSPARTRNTHALSTPLWVVLQKLISWLCIVLRRFICWMLRVALRLVTGCMRLLTRLPLMIQQGRQSSQRDSHLKLASILSPLLLVGVVLAYTYLFIGESTLTIAVMPDAAIFIDGQFLTQTPSPEVFALDSGKHEVACVLKNGSRYGFSVTLHARKAHMVRINMLTRSHAIEHVPKR